MSKEERDKISDPTKLGALDRKAYVVGVINDEIDAKIKENGEITSEEYSQAIYVGQNSVANWQSHSPMNDTTLNRERAFVGGVPNYNNEEARNNFIQEQDEQYARGEVPTVPTEGDLQEMYVIDYDSGEPIKEDGKNIDATSLEGRVLIAEGKGYAESKNKYDTRVQFEGEEKRKNEWIKAHGEPPEGYEWDDELNTFVSPSVDVKPVKPKKPRKRDFKSVEDYNKAKKEYEALMKKNIELDEEEDDEDDIPVAQQEVTTAGIEEETEVVEESKKELTIENLNGKEVIINGVPYLINPRGQVDGKDVIIKKEDYDNIVIGGNQFERDQNYRNNSVEIEREGYDKNNFVKDVKEGKISYDPDSEYNTTIGSDIEVMDEEDIREMQEQQEEISTEHEKYGYEKEEWDQLSPSQQQIIREQYEMDPTGTEDPLGTIAEESTEEEKKRRQQLEKDYPRVTTGDDDADNDGIPDTIDIDAGTGTDQTIEGVTPPVTTTDEEGPNLMEKIGSGVGATLKGAGTLLDSIGGPSAIISYIMGKEGLKHAMKEVEPQKMPELSPLFHQHLRQTKELAKKGFHPAEARKIRKEIDAAYELGLDNAIRGTAGDRAKFLAQSGILDAKRSSALLDFAVQDAALQRQNQDKYVDTMMFKENFEAQRSEKLRAEDMQMQLANKQSAAQFTSAAFSNLMSGLGGSNSALIKQMMNMYQSGGAGTQGLFNTVNPK